MSPRSAAARAQPIQPTDEAPAVAGTSTKSERKLYVLDTTAVDGPREHDMPVLGRIARFKFEPGKPLAMPYPIAMKFLAIEAFQQTDEDGTIIPRQRRPKQPDELEAGENLVLADDETVARYDELSSDALYDRCMALPGGEKFADKASRPAMVKFIIDTKKAQRAARMSKESDVGKDDFVPEAEFDDE